MINNIVYNVKRLLKKPFKIGIITYRYPGESPTNTGVGLHCHYLSRELAKIGCEVHIFCFGKGRFNKKEYLGEGKLIIHRIDPKLPVINDDKYLSGYLSAFVFDNKIMEEVVKENLKENFEVIHSNGRLIGGIFISKYLSNIVWVNTIHSLEKNRLKFMSGEEKKYANIFKWMENTIQHADAVIGVSNNLRSEILKGYPVKEKKVFYVPNGVDRSIFYRDNSIPEEKKVIYVGRFSPEKGIDLLPKIINAALYHDKELKFELVASDDRLPDSMLKIKKQFELLQKKYPDRFIWQKEILSGADLAKKYNESMILIQPSLYESFGMTVAEAMACGTAVIVSDKGALGEIIGNAGLVVPLNASSFVREILNLSKDYKLRERFVRRGMEKIKEYDWEKIAKQTLDIYKLVSGKTNEDQEKEQKSQEGVKNLEEIHKTPDQKQSNN